MRKSKGQQKREAKQVRFNQWRRANNGGVYWWTEQQIGDFVGPFRTPYQTFRHSDYQG